MTRIELAYESEEGIQATCPTTGMPYLPALVRYSAFNGRRVVNCACRWCDAERRTRQDKAFDPSEPQWHVYQVAQP